MDCFGPERGPLIHHTRVSEALHEAFLSLDRGIAHYRDLVRVVDVPPATVNRMVEHQDVSGLHEIDEGVAHAALVVEVNPNVHEVIPAMEDGIDDSLHIKVANFVWDVAQHDRRAVFAVADNVGRDNVIAADALILRSGTGARPRATEVSGGASVAHAMRISQTLEVLHRVLVLVKVAGMKEDTLRTVRSNRSWSGQHLRWRQRSGIGRRHRHSMRE